MIEFFTETLSGTTYFITVIICVILILALIGVMSEIKYIEPINTPSINKENDINSEQGNIIQSQSNSITPSVPEINNNANNNNTTDQK